MSEDAIALKEQLEYYQARATEYDEWWLRTGRYDRGEELNARWFADAEEVRNALAACAPRGSVLELASGTGIWSAQLKKHAEELTLVDGSAEMLRFAESKLGSSRVRYLQANIFEWAPDRRYDFVFFSFWLSHVPPERFQAFWRMVESCLAPGGRVFFIDSQHEQTSTDRDHRLPPPESTVLKRRLNDGREFQIYKVFYDHGELADRLTRLGWNISVQRTRQYFIHGSGSHRPVS